MTLPEIIEALTPYTGHFPREAVKAAIDYKDEITPHLLHALEEVAAAPERFARQEYMLHLFATYLLAQFRDQRAYRPLCKILAAPGRIADDLFGDTITERLDNILASVFDGDPEPIKRLVEADEVDEFVRGAAVETFVILFRTGQMGREQVVGYYRELFHGKLHRECGQVWNALASCLGSLPAPELIPELRRSYEEGLIDPMVDSLQNFERDACIPFEEKKQWQREKQTLVNDAVSEMDWWAAFRSDDEVKPPKFDKIEGRAAAEIESETQFLALHNHGPEESHPAMPAIPFVRDRPKIGRNDPCPCGSGKKHKWCCFGKTL